MSDTLQLKPIHPVATLLNHLRLIGLITIGGTALLVLLILLRVKPTYTAESALEVNMVTGRLLSFEQEKNFTSRIQYTDYLNTQVSYIVSYENMLAAIKKVDLSQTPLQPGETEAETIDHFRRMVSVRWVPNTNLISINVSSSNPKGLHLLTNALVDAYLEGYRAHEMGSSTQRMKKLEEEEQQRRGELAEMNDTLTLYTTELGTVDLEDGILPQEQTLTNLRESVNAAYFARITAENAYNALTERVKAERELDVVALVEEQLDEQLAEQQAQLREARTELARQAGNLTEDHPRMIELSETVKRLETHLEGARTQARAEAEQHLRKKQSSEWAHELLQARSEYLAHLKTEQDLHKKYEQELALLHNTIPTFLKADQLRREINRTHDRITQINSRLEELKIEGEGANRMRIQARAMEPRFPSKNRRKIYAAMALLMCFGFGLVLAFGKDFLEPSIISPQHMAQIIGTRPTGVLAAYEGEDFGQLLRDEPKSYDADQFRRIMPRLFPDEIEGRKPRIFTVIGLSKAAGATSFALNCMTHLRDIGKRAGMLEITDTTAQLNERINGWGLRQEPLRLESELARTFPLDQMVGDGLEFYSFDGPRNKSTLSNKERLRELLETLSERTETLIIEAPSILQHSETELFCRYSDVVVLVVNGPETSPGELKRGMALLKEIGVTHAAVIANNLPVLPGGYFKRAKAAYEGKELKYPLLAEIINSVKRAISPGRKA